MIGQELEAFWRERITGPDVLVTKRSALDLGWRALRKQWAGLIDTSRLQALVRNTLSPDDFDRPYVRAAFGAVSLETGAVGYEPTGIDRGRLVIERIIASTQEPVVMPLFRIGTGWFYDGGLRELAPLKQAIVLGATRIVVVACQPEDVGPLETGFDRGDPFQLTGRVLEIITNELLNGDLETLVETNALIAMLRARGLSLEGKREIPLLVVRPAARIAVEITRFGAGEVDRMLAEGRATALGRVDAALDNEADPGHPIAADLSRRGHDRRAA